MGKPNLDRRGVTTTELRDFSQLVDRYEALLRTVYTGAVVGNVEGYPFYHLSPSGDSAAPQRWLLSAGMHGDEPAGHLALLEFLETDAQSLQGRVDLNILPCINPWGYIHDRRENAQGIDINRAFEDKDLAEVRLCKTGLETQHFDLLLEFHEDWEFDRTPSGRDRASRTRSDRRRASITDLRSIGGRGASHLGWGCRRDTRPVGYLRHRHSASAAMAVPDRTVYPIHHIRDALEGVGSGRASGRASARGESLCAVAGPAQLGQILAHQRYERNLSTFSRIFWGRTGFDR